MPPRGTQIPLFVTDISTTSLVDDNGIFLNIGAALYYIPDGNTDTNLNNFRIVREGPTAANWDFDVRNSYLICVQNIITNSNNVGRPEIY